MKMKNFENQFNKNPFKSLALCYAVIILATLIIQGALGLGRYYMYKSGQIWEKQLTLNDFTQIGTELVDPMQIITATDDAQLIYTDKGVNNLYIKCDFSIYPGEFVLFYANDVEDGFSTAKMLYAKRYGDYYVFRLPFGTEKVRVDLGIFPSVTINFDEIIVNKYSFNEIMRFSTAQIFWLLVIPSIIFTFISLFLSWKEKIKLSFNKKSGK